MGKWAWQAAAATGAVLAIPEEAEMEAVERALVATVVKQEEEMAAVGLVAARAQPTAGAMVGAKAEASKEVVVVVLQAVRARTLAEVAYLRRSHHQTLQRRKT